MRSAHHDFVLGVFKFRHRDHALVAARRQQSRFVDQIRQIRTRKSGSAARDFLRIDIGSHRAFLHMHQQNFLASRQIGIRHDDLTVETPRTQQSGVKHVGTVRRGNQNHRFVRIKAVHFDQQLVQRLFPLIVPAAQSRAAVTPDRVDFVDKDQTRRVFFGLFKHIAHARRADADEHFNKIGTRNRKERHVRFARNRFRQQRLARPRRSDQQHAAGDFSAQALEPFGVFQIIDDFDQILFGFINARDIGESDFALPLYHAGAGFAEAHRLAVSRRHLAHKEHPHADEQNERQPVHNPRPERAFALQRNGGDAHILFQQHGDQSRVVGSIQRELAPVGQLTRDFVALQDDFLHFAVLHLLRKFGKSQRRRGAVRHPARIGIVQRKQQHTDNQPNKYVFVQINLKPLKAASIPPFAPKETRAKKPPDKPFDSVYTPNAGQYKAFPCRKSRAKSE